MKSTITVNMKAEYIYDLMLFQVYSRFSGFLVNLLGLTIIIIGGMKLRANELTLLQTSIYLLAGIAILVFTPFQLKARAKLMMKEKKNLSEIKYTFDENGILEEVNESQKQYSWDAIEKAISTPKTISFYLNDTDVLIMPKISFGDAWSPIMNLVLANMPVKKIQIR